MSISLRRRISHAINARQNHRRELTAFAFSAVMIALVVALGLHQRGIAMTHTKQVLDCHYAGTGAHTHDESCYDTDGNLVCPLQEREYHVHDDSCYAERRELACGMEEHTHSEGCYDTEGNLTCDISEHVHTDACYDVTRELACGKVETTETHTHGPGCFRTVTIDDADAGADAGTDAELEGEPEPEATAASVEQDAAMAETAAPDDDTTKFPEQAFEHEFKDQDGNLVLRVDVKAPEGALPEGSTMQAEWIDPATMSKKQQAAVEKALAMKADGKVIEQQAVDITFLNAQGSKVEPAKKVTVTFTSGLIDTDDQVTAVHLDNLTDKQLKAQQKALDAGKTAEQAEPKRTADAVDELSEQELAEHNMGLGANQLAFESDQFSTYVLSVTSVARSLEASDGKTYTVTLDASASAGIPANAELRVSEIRTDSDAHEAYEADAVEALGAEGNKVPLSRFFDIKIVGPDGQEVQPAVPVQVRIELADAPEDAEAGVVHFDDETGEPEVVEAQPEGEGTTAFDAEGFSVYGVVYTVDFHWNVDGREFDFSIPGGGFVSFHDLVETLGIAQDDADTEADEVQELVDGVEDIAFSDPALVSVSKVEEDTTVGAIKESLGLECEYSAELTEEQITEINAQAAKAGDWALISLKPFTSEETLTVTMKNGDVWTVRVTDAQINVTSLDDLIGKEFALITSGNKLLADYESGSYTVAALDADLTKDDFGLGNVPKWTFTKSGTQYLIKSTSGKCLRISASLQNNGLWIGSSTQPLNVQIHNGRIKIYADQYQRTVCFKGNGFGADPNANGDNAWFTLYEMLPTVTFSGTHQNRGNNGHDPEYAGAQDKEIPVTVGNNGIASVILLKDSEIGHPSNYKAPDGTSNGWKLAGWYDITHNQYYAVSDDIDTVANVEPGTVFYADWVPVSYDYGQNKDALGGILQPGTTAGTVPDLSGFVKTEVFDFSTIFNMNHPSNQNVYFDGTRWRVGNNDYAFVFFDDNSTGSGSFDNPQYRGNPNNDYYNSTRNVWTGNSRVYPGIYNSTIWGQGTVQDALFGNQDLLGKYKVGEGSGLFYINEDGLYEYDSAKHAASYNQTDGKFYIYNETQTITESGGTAFLPFNGEETQYSRLGSHINYWFGIKSTIDFDLEDESGPNSTNKDINGKDLVFHFSGDDDVWVVVDGQLVLDIGGIHSASTGYINFTTGKYSVNGEPEKDIHFDAGNHKLEFYYLERGASDSNCEIQFNITRTGNLEFQKTDGKNEKLGGAKFSIYRDPECTTLLTKAYRENGVVKYREYHAFSSNDNGHVVFENVPVGTYYLREDEPPAGYERDERTYVAKIVVENAGTSSEAETHVYWNEHPYDKIKNEKSFPLEIKKAWVINGNQAEWPAGHEVAYKVVRHTYLALDPAWELDEMPEIVSAQSEIGSGMLTADSPSAVMEDLPKTGVWTAPSTVPADLLNYGVTPGQRCYVYYQYEVVEDAANSVKPADSPYTYTPQSVFAVEGQVTLVEQGQPVEVDGEIGELVNKLSTVTVEKAWSDGADAHSGDSVTVQLYRYTQKHQGSGEDVGDETIRLSLTTNWMNEDGSAPAPSDDVPTDGNIVVKVTGNGKTYRAILSAANEWTAEVPGLPKYDSAKNLITYTAVIESVNKGANILQVSDLGSPSITFSETDKSQTIAGRVKTKQDLNEDMEVIFDANWIDELNASATPSSDAQITANITSSDGSTHTVTLNKANGYTQTVTLPRVSHGVAVTHTVSYTSSGTNVIQNDVTGLQEFGGETSQIHVTGRMQNVVAPNKMNLVVEALNITSTDGSPWEVRLNAGGTIHTSDWQKQKSFTPTSLKEDSRTAYANDLDLKEANNQTAVYYFSLQADHANIKVRSDNGNVVVTNRGNNLYDIAVTAVGGEVRIYVEDLGAKRSLKLTARRAPRLTGSGTGNFTEDQITSDNLQLPEGAEPVGSAVTLDSNVDWNYVWPNLPSADENGNKYYYYVKETGVSTAAGSHIIAINASYDYSAYGDTATITVTNTPEYEQPTEVTIHIQKQNAKTKENLGGAVFSLWKYDETNQDYVQIDGNVAVDSTGKATKNGLTVGSYQLREVTAPAGFIKSEDPIAFSVSYDGTVTFADTDMVTYKSATSTFEIGNEPGVALPNSGGSGTTAVYLLGIMLTSLAGAGLVMRRRRVLA